MKRSSLLLLAASVASAEANAQQVPDVQLTEIKAENAVGAIDKLLKTGFLKPHNEFPVYETQGVGERELKKHGVRGSHSHESQAQTRTSAAKVAAARKKPPQNGPAPKRSPPKPKPAPTKRAHHEDRGRGHTSPDYAMPEPDVDDDFFLNGGEFAYDIEAFLDTRNLNPPILTSPNSTDEFDAGTVYIYSNAPLWDVFGIESDALVGVVQGTCTRTDPESTGSSAYLGRGVCQLTFEALDLNQVVASFTAEGPISNGPPASLTVTGGLGMFAGATGYMTMTTAFLDTSVVPPPVFPDGTVDFLTPIDGYLIDGVLYTPESVSLFEDDILQFDDDFFGFEDDFFGTNDDIPGETDDMTNQTVICDETMPSEFCDCNSDCMNFADTRCVCAAAQACCGFI